MPIRVPVEQTGLERSIQKAAQKAGRNLKVDLGTNAKSIKSLEQPLGRITGKADEFTKSLEASNARVIAFGASVGIINGVVQSFKALVSTTIEVEKSLTKINSILNATVPQLNSLKNQIFEIAKNTEQTFDVVAEAALELSRQGLSATEVTKRLNDSLILSRLAGIDASEAVAGLTAAVNSFSKAGLTTGDVLNKISAAANKFAVSERDLIEGFKRSASVAEQAGVSIDELGGIITAVQQRTARGGAVIGNSFKTIFTRIGRAENLQLLSDLGVQITDVQGKILPATKLIENLAQKLEDLDQVQVRSITEKIGGGFQIAPLLAALSDYSSETSIAIQATEAFANATNEAYKKNEIQNQTLSAAINRTSLSIRELANALGEVGVLDVFKNLLDGLNSFTQRITSFLQGDDIGSKFAKSILGGLGETLIKGGIVLFGAIVAKLAIDLAKFGVSSLKTFLGLGKEAERLKNVQQQIVNTLLSDKGVRESILNIENQSISTEQKRLQQAEFFNTALRERIKLTSQLSGIATGVAPNIIGGSGGRVRRSAEGFLPVGAEQKDISKGVGGAPKGAKPVVIPNFSFGGGKKGTMVANDSEYIVPNFAGGGDAVFNQDMAKSMGLPKGARKITAAGGFIPNFARTLTTDEKKFNEFLKAEYPQAVTASGQWSNAKALPLLQKSYPGLVSAGQATASRLYQDSPLRQKWNSFDDTKKKSFALRGTQRRGLREKSGKQSKYGIIYPDAIGAAVSQDINIGEIGGIQYSAKAIPVQSRVPGGLYADVRNKLIDSASNYIGEVGFPAKLLDRASFREDVSQNLNEGSVKSAFGTAFDAGFTGALGSKQRANATWDLPDSGSIQNLYNKLTKGSPLKQTQGDVSELSAADFKNTLSKPNLQSIVGKIQRTEGVTEAAEIKPKGRVERSAGGYIPNFAAGVGIYDSDYLQGPNKKLVLDQILASKKRKDLLVAPAGAGKSTVTQKTGGKPILSVKDIAKFSKYLILSASAKGKNSLFTAPFQKILDSVKSSGGDIQYLYVSNDELDRRRRKRLDEGAIDPRGERSLRGTLRAPKNQFDFISGLKRTGGSVIRGAEGYVPNFAYTLGENKDSISIRSVTSPIDEKTGQRKRGTGAVKTAITAAVAKADKKGFSKITADIISDPSLNAFKKYFGKAKRGKNIWDKSEFNRNAARGYIPNFAQKEIRGQAESVSSITQKRPRLVGRINTINNNYKKLKKSNKNIVHANDKVQPPIIKVNELDINKYKGLLQKKYEGQKAKQQAEKDIEALASKDGIRATKAGLTDAKGSGVAYGSSSSLDAVNLIVDQKLAKEVKSGVYNPESIVTKFLSFPIENSDPKETNVAKSLLNKQFSENSGETIGYKRSVRAELAAFNQQELRAFNKELEASNKNAASGYIPNFAMSPLEDAIQREKNAGIPVNQIRINQDGKLRNSQNPQGLAVTNTRDEPTGKIPNFASLGSNPFSDDGLKKIGFTFDQIYKLGNGAVKLAQEFDRLQKETKEGTIAADQAGKAFQKLAKKEAVTAGLDKGATGKLTEAAGDAFKETEGATDDLTGKLLGLSLVTSLLGNTLSNVDESSNAVIKGFAGITEGVLSAVTTLSLISTIDVKKFTGQDPIGASALGRIIPKALITKGSGTFASVTKAFTGIAKTGLRLVPLLGQLFAGFQVFNSITKTFGLDLGKTVGEFIGVIDTPAEKAAKNLEKLSNAALKAALETGKRSEKPFEDFAKNVGTLSQEGLKEKLTESSQTKAKAGEDVSTLAFSEALGQSLTLGKVEDKVLNALLKTGGEFKGLSSKISGEKLTEIRQGLISGDDISGRGFSGSGTSAGKVQTFKDLNFAVLQAFASDKEFAEVGGLVKQGKRKEAGEKITSIIDKLPADVKKDYEGLIDKISSTNLSDEEAKKVLEEGVKKLQEYKKTQTEVQKSQELSKKIELEIADIRRKSITESAIQLTNLKSQVQLAQELALAKKSSTAEEKLNAQFQLDAINSQKKLTQEVAKAGVARIEGSRESLGLTQEPGGEIKVEKERLFNSLVQEANKQLIERGRINIESLKALDKEGQLGKQQLINLENIVKIANEEAAALSKQEKLQLAINSLAKAQAALTRINAQEDERRIKNLEKQLDFNEKNLDIEQQIANARAELRKAEIDAGAINGNQFSKFSATQQKAEVDANSLIRNFSSQINKSVGDAARDALNQATSSGVKLTQDLVDRLKTIQEGGGTGENFKSFINDLEEQSKEAVKRERDAAIDKSIAEINNILAMKGIVDQFGRFVSEFTGKEIPGVGGLPSVGDIDPSNPFAYTGTFRAPSLLGGEPIIDSLLRTRTKLKGDKGKDIKGNILTDPKLIFEKLQQEADLAGIKLSTELINLANSVKEAGGSLTTFANLVRNELNGIPERLAQALFTVATSADPSAIQSGLGTIQRETFLRDTGDISGANELLAIENKRLDIVSARTGAEKIAAEFELQKLRETLALKKEIAAIDLNDPKRAEKIFEIRKKIAEIQSKSQSFSQKFQSEFYQTERQKVEELQDTIVSGARKFSDTLASGLNDALVKGDDLGDILVGAANDFFAELNKKAIGQLLDTGINKIFGGIFGDASKKDPDVAGSGGGFSGDGIISLKRGEDSSNPLYVSNVGLDEKLKENNSLLGEALGEDVSKPGYSQLNPLFVTIVGGGIGAGQSGATQGAAAGIQGGGRGAFANIAGNVVGSIPVVGPLLRGIFGFNQGGMVNGGSGTKDDVPALLTGGEYVMKKSAVSKYGDRFMEDINTGKAPQGIQKFANGGLVKKEEEIQSGQGGFFIPGTYGGTIQGKEDLLSFASQSFTSGARDVAISGAASSGGGGFAGVSLEAESVRLTNFGRKLGTPLQQATQSAKEQAFGIRTQQLDLEKQLKEQEKARKKAFRNQLISAAISVAAGAAVRGFTQGFGNVSGGAAKGVNSSGQFLNADNQVLKGVTEIGQQGFLADPSFLQKLGSGFKGSIFGGGIPGQQGTFGGLKNTFSARGYISNERELFDYIQKNPDSALAKNTDLFGTASKAFEVPETLGQIRTNKFKNNLRATGGPIPETAGVDTVPTMLSGGEFIMNSAAADRVGRGNLEKMNSGLAEEEESKGIANDELLRKLDDLIEATKESTGEINITVNGDTGREEESSNGENGEGNRQFAKKLKEEVVKIIQEEKRLGGSLRNDKL